MLKRKKIMKTMFTLILLLLVLTISTSNAQKKKDIIAQVKNSEVVITLNKLIDYSDSKTRAKDGHKFYVAEVTIENISSQTIDMGSEYTMSISVKDEAGKEYRSGLRGAGIVSFYLSQFGNKNQDQKAYNLCFSSNFPAKTKARSILCGFEVPKDAKIVSFGVKNKNLWSSIK